MQLIHTELLTEGTLGNFFPFAAAQLCWEQETKNHCERNRNRDQHTSERRSLRDLPH